MEAAIELLQQSHFFRHVIVFMYLSLQLNGGALWVRMLVRLGRFIDEAGMAIYSQICDQFVTPAAAVLVFGGFPADLMAFDLAFGRAERLRVFTPFVHFLDQPDASFFEVRNVQSLIS